MAEHYHDENDLKLMREMRKLAPEDFNAWLGLNNIVGRENGAIPKKYRELIAIAVSCTTQCPYCLEAHASAAHAAGATREEVVETFQQIFLQGILGSVWTDRQVKAAAH